mmetsp:Transcript_28898/g.67359  ORF Transcript_28898/g.67359 Transcript_28898/m.67359 type:complete len:210 (-) Transcript_28898:110-739(-)
MFISCEKESRKPRCMLAHLLFVLRLGVVVVVVAAAVVRVIVVAVNAVVGGSRFLLVTPELLFKVGSLGVLATQRISNSTNHVQVTAVPSVHGNTVLSKSEIVVVVVIVKPIVFPFLRMRRQGTPERVARGSSGWVDRLQHHGGCTILVVVAAVAAAFTQTKITFQSFQFTNGHQRQGADSMSGIHLDPFVWNRARAVAVLNIGKRFGWH